MKEENIKTKYPVEMVSFSDEEGRFGGLFGSQALCGEITPENIHNATDLNGIRRADEMKRHGLIPMDALQAHRRPGTLHAYLELHIEQGPVLDTKKIPIGVVSEITGLFTWRVRLIGNADHAGTTPMHMRHDAFMGLSEFAQEISRIIEEHGSDHSVTTIGKVSLSPGTTNTVPGQVEFSLDVRDTSQSILDDLSDAYRRTLSAIARRRQLMFEFDINSEVPPVKCNPSIVDAIVKTVKKQNIPHLIMPSGAAHDAQIMSHITNVGMIFVPSKNGKSHSPAEWTHWEDIHTGANVMLHTTLNLAQP
jgi:N-carbamoyl-L-amino-acid hydrolase